MKKFFNYNYQKLILVLTLLVLGVVPGLGQISGGTAYRIISGTSLPATCEPGPGVTDVYILTSGSTGIYWCSATNTWTASGGGGGGGGITIGTTTITSGTDTRVLYNNAGVVGEYPVTGSTNVVMSASPTLTGTVAAAAATFSGTIVQTSASATAFESGPNGGTNPVFRLVNSTASQADGVSITGLAAGSGVTFQALSSGSNAPIQITTKGTGAITLTAGSGGITTSTGGNVTIGTTGSVSLGNSGNYMVVNSVNARLASGVYIGISSAADNSALSDVVLRRAAAATWALGFADAASPVAQTLSVQNVVGGTTNTAGVTTSLIGSLGSSQGAPGRIHLKGGAMIAASGTTQQTAVDRIISGATKVLTNNSAITIANVTNASNTNAGGRVDYCVEVEDGTDMQYECGSATYGITNKAGVWSGNTVTKAINHQNASSGTLTVTIAISGANPALLSVNANSSLTPSTGFPRITYTLQNLGQQAVAIQ